MNHSVLIITLLYVVFSLYSCSGKERNAHHYLSEAEQAYNAGNYSLSKLKIDSIKTLFPKSFREINDGFVLLQKVRMAENVRNIAYCDSMLRESYNRLNEWVSKFDYIRDDRYQEFGEYYPKAYPYATSLSRNGLRSGVREKGALFIESVLSGAHIKHHTVRVIVPDGSYLETLSVASDGFNYRFDTLDNSYEIVRFCGDAENGVAKFIYTFQKEPIRVMFIGSRSVTVTLTDAAKKGICDSFELSSLLLNIEQLKLEKEKSEALIRYLKSKK